MACVAKTSYGVSQRGVATKVECVAKASALGKAETSFVFDPPGNRAWLSSLHFVNSALAIEDMPRCAGALILATLGFSAAAHIGADLVAADGLFLWRDGGRFFWLFGHCQTPLMYLMRIDGFRIPDGRSHRKRVTKGKEDCVQVAHPNRARNPWV
jgi:hypothetical protein